MAPPNDSKPEGRRAPLPEGTVPVAIGLFIAGVASYLFLKVGKIALGSDEALQPITSLWVATFALAPGVFLPLEQELTRALAHRRATGIGGRPVLRRVITLGAVMAAVVGIGIVAVSKPIARSFFNDDWVLVLALIIAFVSYTPAHIARGIASGHGRFRAYSIVMSSDGVVRIALCAALAVAGVDAVGPYGLAIAFAPLPGVLWVAATGQLRTDDGPPAEWNEVTQNLGWLLAGSICAAGLVNAGPLAVTVLASEGQEASVTRFTYGVLLARVPLFMFQAVQAALLPRLSGLAARNEITEFREGLARLLKVVLAVAVVGTVGAYLLGPFVIEQFYDSQLDGRTLALLALSSAIYMLALALAQAVIALRGHALVAMGWAGAGLTFLLVVSLNGGAELFTRVEIALISSSCAALLLFAAALRLRLRAGATATGSSVVEAITDVPLES
ncbi:MAG: lipopolysaccharide biosynthesis protein [Ilumatobacteraceae bacterium]